MWRETNSSKYDSEKRSTAVMLHTGLENESRSMIVRRSRGYCSQPAVLDSLSQKEKGRGEKLLGKTVERTSFEKGKESVVQKSLRHLFNSSIRKKREETSDYVRGCSFERRGFPLQ